jgi:hypothetical protein
VSPVVTPGYPKTSRVTIVSGSLFIRSSPSVALGFYPDTQEGF